MSDFDFKALLGTVAPALATAFGGPLAGMAAKAGLSALGLDPEPGNEEEQFATAMATATPADMLKLKQADHQFRLDMEQIGVDLEKIAATDRASARQREIQTGDNAPKVLAVVVVSGFFATLGSIAFVAIPEAAQAPVNILLGALTAMLTQVGNYYFGSSAGSARKTEMLKAGDNG